jgi:hypothetical protein
MGILNVEENEKNMDKNVLVPPKVAKRIADFLVRYGAVRCFVAEEQVDILKKKISEAWNLSNIKWRTPFSERIERDVISKHNEHKERPLLSLDCRALHKGDAYGWLKAISEGMQNGSLNKPILVIENVDQIPDGDRSVYDDPQYIENILVRPWKNELINIGDFYLNRPEMSIILTCSPDNQTMLSNACRECSYNWGGEFEEWLAQSTEDASKMVQVF